MWSRTGGIPWPGPECCTAPPAILVPGGSGLNSAALQIMLQQPVVKTGKSWSKPQRVPSMVVLLAPGTVGAFLSSYQLLPSPATELFIVQIPLVSAKLIKEIRICLSKCPNLKRQSCDAMAIVGI